MIYLLVEDISQADINFALLLSLLAGLSTGFGSLIAYFIKKPKMSYLSVGLGISAGAMIYVSFVELIPESFEVIGDAWGMGFFFIGIGIMMLIDVLIPDIKNPHHIGDEKITLLESEEKFKAKRTASPEEPPHACDLANLSEKDCQALMKTGVFTAIAIAIHNFPEGIAVFGTAISDAQLGILIAIAVAMHNIPEGISVSIPIFYATGSKAKAFWYSFASGLAEPLGAFIAYLFLMPILTEAILASVIAFIAGIMIYISLDEILPAAHKYGRGHQVIVGVIIGMFVIALTLLVI